MLTHDTTRRIPRTRRSRRTVAALAAAAAALAFAPSAHAGQSYEADVKLGSAPVAMSCPVSFPMACFDPSDGNRATATVKFHRKFQSIEAICFELRFEGDLIDPGPSPDQRGDWVQILFAGNDGFGFLNWSEPSFDGREVCAAPTEPSGESAFADGREDITVNMVLGSATLADVRVSLDGVAK